MDVLAGDDATLRVDFVSPTGTLLPDAGSVSYRVYGTDGSPLAGPTSVATSDTGVTLTIDGALNTIEPPRIFEKRIVIVKMASNGEPFVFQTDYRVIPFLNMTASAADVRSVIGATSDELPDEDIDLLQAYLLVRDAAGAAPL